MKGFRYSYKVFFFFQIHTARIFFFVQANHSIICNTVINTAHQMTVFSIRLKTAELYNANPHTYKQISALADFI